MGVRARQSVRRHTEQRACVGSSAGRLREPCRHAGESRGRQCALGRCGLGSWNPNRACRLRRRHALADADHVDSDDVRRFDGDPDHPDPRRRRHRTHLRDRRIPARASDGDGDADRLDDATRGRLALRRDEHCRLPIQRDYPLLLGIHRRGGLGTYSSRAPAGTES